MVRALKMAGLQCSGYGGRCPYQTNLIFLSECAETVEFIHAISVFFFLPPGEMIFIKMSLLCLGCQNVEARMNCLPFKILYSN